MSKLNGKIAETKLTPAQARLLLSVIESRNAYSPSSGKEKAGLKVLARRGVVQLVVDVTEMGTDEYWSLAGELLEAYNADVAGKAHKRTRRSEPRPEGGWPRPADDTINTCTKCEEDKPASQFHTDKSRKQGLMAWCKGCLSAHYSAKRAERKAMEAKEVEPPTEALEALKAAAGE